MGENALVSIISLNYNETELTCDFLKSLRSLNYTNFEVIVVDNASKENPKERVMEVFPEAKFLRSDANLGYAGGNNLGIKAAKGDLYFIVNNDTEVTPDLLDKLVQPFREEERIGIVCPKIKYHDQPNIIQYAGYTEMNPYTGRNKVIGGKATDNGQFDDGYMTSYCHGAAMMVSKTAVEKVGLIPENFFLCYEELDWSRQMCRAGFQIYYEGSATIFHKESMTMGKESPLKTYFHFRNRILFMRRNYGGFHLFIFCLYTLFVVFPKTFLQYALQRKVQHLRSIVYASLWHMKIRPTFRA